MVRRKLTRMESVGWRVGLAFIDEVLIFTALLVALWVRFEDHSLSWIMLEYVAPHMPSILLAVAFYFIMLALFHLYQHAWWFSIASAARSLFFASMFGTMGMLAIPYLMDGSVLPRGVIASFWPISALMVGGLRVVLRAVVRMINPDLAQGNGTSKESVARVRALIVGQVDYGIPIAKAVKDAHSLRHYDIIGFLDDRPEQTGLIYGGVQVLGKTSLLTKYLDKKAVDEVIFALSDESDRSDIRDLVMECRKRKVRAKVIQNLADHITRPNIVRLEDIQVEDLLRRPARTIDVGACTNYLVGKRVLITGAGGSIGSEICRQVVNAGPAGVILVGHGENSIFQIQQELKRRHPERCESTIAIIASVADRNRIDRVFKRFRPEIVFHAAAHKHLPLMEDNVCEAVRNNIIGMHNVSEACARYGVERMVLISTDKAAEPTSVMGATKAICEVIARSFALKFLKTSFICVRFGNVLGSRGSVIPVFQEQIRNGGPVTVTHPEMTRFFMSIPEAVRLVIQAGEVGKSGSVYLLDMGKPVKILDLAEDMIRLNGYEPGVDIEVVFTGIRAGEKMHERLASAGECVEPMEYEGLNVLKCENGFQFEETIRMVEKFDQLSSEMDGEGVLQLFEDVIPGYANKERPIRSTQLV